MKEETVNKPGAIIIEGHVQGLSNLRSLGEAGIPVFVVDKDNCIARYSRFCKKYFRCPDYVKDEFALFLINLAQKEKIKNWVLIPSNDHAVYTISKHKTALEEYYKVITPCIDIINNIYDKINLLNIAKKCGVPFPYTWHFETLNDTVLNQISFPVIIKGRYGLSFYKAFQKKALVANNIQELKQQMLKVKNIYEIRKTFSQELIQSTAIHKPISFTSFCIDGEIKTYWMGIKLREHPLQFGTATFAKSINIKECYIQSIPILQLLNYTGVCEIEYLFDRRSKQYKLIEINARTWLWVGLAKSCGIDYAKLIYNYANNLNIEFPVKYSIDLKWINYLTDTLMSIKAILTRRLSISEYLISMKGKKVKAFFSWRDIKPGIMILPLSFYLARKRNIF